MDDGSFSITVLTIVYNIKNDNGSYIQYLNMIGEQEIGCRSSKHSMTQVNNTYVDNLIVLYSFLLSHLPVVLFCIYDVECTSMEQQCMGSCIPWVLMSNYR